MSVDDMESGHWSPEALAHRRILEARKRRRDENDELRCFGMVFNGYHYVNAFLRLTGLYWLGRRVFMNPVLSEDVLELPSLPEAFDGFRILHLSDTHFDLEPKLTELVSEMIRGVEYDVCLITGDFRDRLTEAGDEGVRLVSDMLSHCGRPVYACLGNHDIHSDAALLESGGIRVLVNESAFIERDGARIYFCGVDDPGYYKTDDFDKAYECVPADGFSIVIAHDPCAFRKAAKYGASLMLCGHTHAGQMCLPGGFALATHSNCLHDMVSGMWRCGDMVGYTSSGVGGSRIAARFFTRGQIVIHTLRNIAR